VVGFERITMAAPKPANSLISQIVAQKANSSRKKTGIYVIVLAVAFRSVLVPLKAIAMNLLSVLAAYGFLVYVFQDGVGADLINLVPILTGLMGRANWWLPGRRRARR